jgi:hypothetical protein
LPLSTVNNKLVAVALAEIDATGFERFGQAFYAALVGRAFVPLGGMHDGGADGYFAPELFGDDEAHHYLQVSKQKTFATKIRGTVARLREAGRIPKSVTYLTSETIPRLDAEEEALSEELGCRIRIRDAKYIETQINESDASVAAFDTYLRPALDHLADPGAAPVSQRVGIYADRTLAIFLRQEVEYRRGKSDLLESVADALILWSLADTDPDKNRLMSRDQILTKIETALPSARKFIRGVLDHRLSCLSVKATAGGRQIRVYKSRQAYCLPYVTREAIKQENIDDEALRLAVTSIFQRRFEDLSTDDEKPLADEVVATCHGVVERLFERQGLQLAQFATDGQDEDELYSNIPELVEVIIDECGYGQEGGAIQRLAVGVLRGTFYDTTPEERTYLQKLSRTYVLLLLLKNEPRIVEYFKTISSRFVLYIGTDFLVRALSEEYLKDENQTTRNLFRVLCSAGSTLILTAKAVEELATHLRAQIFEFENHYMNMENRIDIDAAGYIDRILIRSYFYARLASVSTKKPPRGWRGFIEQFASYEAIRANRGGEELARYLVAKFDMRYESTEEMMRGLGGDDLDGLADEILRVRSEGGYVKENAEILAYNDAAHVLRVYERRQQGSEGSPANPFGFHTWWLTQDAKVRRAAAHVVAGHHGHRFMMRPEFLLNFILFSPSQKEVEESYRTIFPSVLGVQLSSRMNVERFKEIMEQANEIWAVDQARAGAIVTDFLNKLKGDMSKIYDINWNVTSGARQNDGKWRYC